MLIIPAHYSRYSVFLPSLFLPNSLNDAFILSNAVHICSHWFFKRCLDYAKHDMCKLICHYFILSSWVFFCSIMLPQSATQVFRLKMVCRCTILTDFPLYVSRHTLFPHFPCVVCRVNSLSLRTISTYLLKLFRCQSFVPSIIVQNNHLPKYTWCSTEQIAEISLFNWTIYLFTPLYKGIMHQIPSQWAHECALYRIRRHIGCLSVANKERLSVPNFILQH